MRENVNFIETAIKPRKKYNNCQLTKNQIYLKFHQGYEICIKSTKKNASNLSEADKINKNYV